eukprot:1147666-Pelagomonas_calceolata.AAC.3
MHKKQGCILWHPPGAPARAAAPPQLCERAPCMRTRWLQCQPAYLDIAHQGRPRGLQHHHRVHVCVEAIEGHCLGCGHLHACLLRKDGAVCPVTKQSRDGLALLTGGGRVCGVALLLLGQRILWLRRTDKPNATTGEKGAHTSRACISPTALLRLQNIRTRTNKPTPGDTCVENHPLITML